MRPQGSKRDGTTQRIGAGLHEMRERLVVADDRADATGMARRGVGEAVFERLVARADERELGAAAVIAGNASSRRSMPFCDVSRLTTPSTNVAGIARRARSASAAPPC